MIRLTTTTQSLEILLAGAVTTNQLQSTVNFTDVGTTYTGGSQLAVSNSTAAATICAAPAASTIRDIDYVNIYNSDTAPAVVTIRINNASAYTSQRDVTLQVDDCLTYTHASGWSVTDSSGSVKQVMSGVLLGATISGNLTFTGTGNRILGDFSNATEANRTAIQTTVVNGISVVPLYPNGSGTRVGFSSPGVIPFDIDVNGANRFRIDTSGNVGIGGIPSAWNTPIKALQITGASIWSNTITHVFSGNIYFDAGYVAKYIASSTGAIVGFNLLGLGGIQFQVAPSGTAGAAATLTTALNIDINANILSTGGGGLGYGTGSGGTVTQLTSKSTAVTLNKPSGQITMNNAALAAGASVQFTLNNSLIASYDLVYPMINYNGNYSVRCVATGPGNAAIILTNISGASLSEAVTLLFAVIKGSIN